MQRKRNETKREALWADHPWTALRLACFPPREKTTAFNHQDTKDAKNNNEKSNGSVVVTKNSRRFCSWCLGGSKKPSLSHLEDLAFRALLWGIDAGDKRAVSIYRQWFRRLPDGEVVPKPRGTGERGVVSR